MCGLLILVGMAIQMYIVYKWDLKAGWLCSQNYNLFAYLIEKPWNHLAAMATGIYFSNIYMRLLEYREV